MMDLRVINCDARLDPQVKPPSSEVSFIRQSLSHRRGSGMGSKSTEVIAIINNCREGVG